MIYLTNNTVFGENLRFIRESSGFTPWYMAKLLNVSEERLHQLETGEYPEIDSLIIRILQNLLEDESVNLLEENISTIL